MFKIDFLGIGTPKSATTWISDNLDKHPEICVSSPKETDFFIDQYDGKEGLGDYENYFSHCGEDKKKGEYSVNYFHNESAPKKIKEAYPNIKLIVSFRNPVEREISEYFHNLRHIGEVSEERANIRLKTMYKGEKKYYPYYLNKWLQHFDKEQFHFILVDDIKNNSQKVLSDLYDFLEVDSDFKPDTLDSKSNKAHTYKFPKLQGMMAEMYRSVKSKSQLNKLFEKSGIYSLGKLLKNKTSETYEKPEIHEDTKKQIYNCFKKDIEELENLIDKNLSSWKI